MSKFRIIFTASLLLALMGCNQEKTPLTPETWPSPQAIPSSSSETPTAATPSVTTKTPQTAKSSPNKSPTAAVPNSAIPAKNQVISPDGIGEAKVGMTYGQLKKQLGTKAEFTVKSPFIVDFDAIAVSQSGKIQYYILYPAGTPLAESAVIDALVTDNPNYRTAEGVGPGTPIQQAETAYGDATLSYNTQNESREYIKFAKEPSRSIKFRASPTEGKQFAGIYSPSPTESKQTKEFEKTASIRLIEVYCGKNCPPQAP
ncbi:MAG: hypothetical protein U7123_09480 [Potamolinea sp.]